jgi:methylmalonyl-CoA/ethylmalonyl-CoA epimerase
VKDIQKAYDAMKRDGFQLIDSAPRRGSRGTTVFFVHPKSRSQDPFEILIEVVEDSQGE